MKDNFMVVPETARHHILDAFLKAYTKLTIIRDGLKQNSKLTEHFRLFAEDIQTQQMLALGEQSVRSTPYDFDANSISYLERLTDEEIQICNKDICLPFPNCWFTFPIDQVTLALMLRDEPEKVITTFILHHGDKEQFEPAEYFDRDTRKKLLALTGAPHFTIVPFIEFNKNSKQIDFKAPPFIYVESHDFLPTHETDNAVGALYKATAEMEDSLRLMIETAISFAGMVVKKSQFQPLIVPPPVNPNRTMDALQLSKGRVPKRKVNSVRVDLTKQKQAAEGNPNSPATKLAKERHWVGAFEYFKPSLGRIVKVPKHERYKASSDVPATPKPRKATASKIGVAKADDSIR